MDLLATFSSIVFDTPVSEPGTFATPIDEASLGDGGGGRIVA
jgi:hypothetical protein